jgi:membrane protease YdiL (CAAX protease family)
LAWTVRWASGPLGRLVGFLGAGIYEELLFRLLLLPAVLGLLRACRVAPPWQAWGAVLLTSLLFSAAHYFGAEPWELRSFVFRFLAGVFFAALFVLRGFGVAAGTHALYDIFVGLF